MPSLGANLGAIRANDFPRQADGSGQTDADHASARTDPDGPERLTGIYGSDGLPSCGRRTGFFSRCPSGWLRLVLSFVLSHRLRRLRL
jgi:hypothetical protein